MREHLEPVRKEDRALARAEMTPRERVMAALNHQERIGCRSRWPRRPAMGSRSWPTEPPEASGDGDLKAQVKDTRGQTAKVDEAVLQRFRVDFRGVGWGRPTVEGTSGSTSGPSRTSGGSCAPGRRAPTTTTWSVPRWPRRAASPPSSGTAGRSPTTPAAPADSRRRRAPAPGDDYAVVVDLNCAFFLRCCELRGWRTSTWTWWPTWSSPRR